MISVEDIYSKTNNGLDIILFFYPQARECLSGRQKHFRIRESDQTPSASLKEVKGIWKVTDFGDSGRAMSPIDICMQEKNLSFTESVFYLAREFNVDGRNISPEINKADIRTRPAAENESDGWFVFQLNDHFSDSELKILGPRVREESCRALGWSSAKEYSTTKNGKTTTISSTENYPIFIRECRYVEADGKSEAHFYKIYQPLNPEKNFRFFYHGAKPQKYVCGLFELKKAYQSHNDQRHRDMINSGEMDEGDTYKYEKLPEAFICSGERDSICVHALGYHPLWFNSESYNLSEFEYREICKYVDKLYNIPDIDATGVKKGIEMASRFIDIYTIWLPDKLRTYKDRRGKPRKDFRDFVEIWPEKDRFRELLNMAMPFRSWEWKKNDKGQGRLELISSYAMHFLRCNGFACIEDKNSKFGKMFVHIQNNIVREVKAKDIRAFFRQFVDDRCLPLDIRELVKNTTRLSETSLDNVDEVTLDFCNHTPYSQFFFFKNGIWEATADQVIVHKSAIQRYVWQEELIEHTVKRLEPMFNIAGDSGETGERNWDIQVAGDNKSIFFKFLINASRIYWRKEFEYNNDQMTEEEKKEYLKKYRYAIDGPLLSPEEIAEQKHHLVNKIFCLGYLLHHYKAENRSWCVFAMDNKEGSTDDENNGGTGKSFCFKTPRLFMKSVTLSGRNPKLITENRHAFENVTEHTKYILIDDSDKYTPFNFFFDVITGDITVNPKNTRSYTIPFEKAPKFCMTSNYTLRNIDPSVARRVLYSVFSDYYHEKTEDNDYLETRTIYDDFGKSIFRENYTEEEWNADINFLVDCCRFYLSVIKDGIKLQPPMGNVTVRNLRSIMGDDFLNWAEIYFSKDSGNCDRLILRSVIYENFISVTGVRNWKANRFSKCMKAFCQYERYIICLNPPKLCNSKDRIIKRVAGEESPKEFYYIQTREKIDEDFSGDLQNGNLKEIKSEMPF
ncbi:MAG: hypothetical protein LBG15_07860 [Dysgonamonadaceae bacterium]|jgi:hypothetical protein|nr:hypothetical protein [Dysgonamonadaceae bacterium]